MGTVRELIRAMLAAISRLFLTRRMRSLIVGDGSKVNFWRVRASEGNFLSIGNRSLVRTEMVFERGGATITIGDRTFVGRGLFTIADRLEIGSDVMISWGVTITDHNSHSVRFSERRNDVEMNAFRGIKNWSVIGIAPVRISDKAWIGFGASILKGVTVGEGAIVGANSVVTRNVAPWTVVAGNPARVIRELPENER